MESNNKTKRHGGLGKWIVTAIVVVLVIWSLKWIWPGHRYEHGWDHRRGGHHWMELSQDEMNERMEHGAEWAFKKLDTTDEQEEVIMAELKSLTPTILKLQGEKLELENRFRAALEQEAVDREALNELLQEVKEITDQSLDQGFESFLTFWEVLTVEQRETLLERWRDKR
jgi:Spy/CpxP family protein refolding chaperone